MMTGGKIIGVYEDDELIKELFFNITKEKAMPLQVTPKPDSIIRVMMDWKGLEEPIKVQEQELETPSREGYTVVEWGGTKIK